MRILVVNDDGINSPGLHLLAEAAAQLGEVTVVAPQAECSGMAQHIKLFEDLRVEKRSIPVQGVTAYSISGTPADCVKLGVGYIMPEKPDLVLSGINDGYNTGYDIAYSGTVGAAMESIMLGIPAIAFSVKDKYTYETCRPHLLPLIKELAAKDVSAYSIWNVNFPGCGDDQLRGVLYDRTPAALPIYSPHYTVSSRDGTGLYLHTDYSLISPEGTPEGSDIHAVLHDYISVGTVRCQVL